MPSSHLILGRPLLLLSPIPPSIRVFSNESTLRMRWPKYWSFSFSIIPSKEIPGLISFRMDWLDQRWENWGVVGGHGFELGRNSEDQENLHYIYLYLSIYNLFIYNLLFICSGGSDGKESACNAGDLSLIPGLERSPGEGNGNPLQYSCLKNPMDRGAWWATVQWVTKNRT